MNEKLLHMANMVGRALRASWGYLWLDLEDFQAIARMSAWELAEQLGEENVKGQFIRRGIVDNLRRLFGVEFKKMGNETPSGVFLEDQFPDLAAPTVEACERADLCEWLLAGLDERERRVVKAVYWEGKTGDEIKEEFGLTRSWVSWLMTKRILPKLRLMCDREGITAT